MKLLFAVFVIVAANFAAAETPKAGNCQTQAETTAKGFLELLLKSEWGWREVLFVDSKASVISYKVVKNPTYSSQKHEDYVFEFKSASKNGAKSGLSSRFEVQMFANQLTDSDEITCLTNSFRLVGVQEGIKLD